MASFSEADLGVVLIFAMVAIPSQLWRFRRLHSERLKTDRYQLFAVRDRWIRLVAEGHLREDDELFKFVYKDLNHIIPKAKPLTLRNIVAALSGSRVINDRGFAKKCRELLEHSDREVREATAQYFEVLIRILIGRSVFVRVSVFITHSGIRTFSLCRRLLGSIFKTETEAYRQHEALRGLCPSLP